MAEEVRRRDPEDEGMHDDDVDEMEDEREGENDDGAGNHGEGLNDYFREFTPFERAFGAVYDATDRIGIEIFNHMSSYLTTNDLKNLRLTTRHLYAMTTTSPKFSKNVELKLTTRSFYESLTNKLGALKEGNWNTVHLRHFSFFNRRTEFKTFWRETMVNLTELTISKSALQCEGLGFLLNQCRQLKTLRLFANRLFDTNLVHRQGDPNLFPQVRFGMDPCANAENPPYIDPRPTVSMRAALKNLEFVGINVIEDCFVCHLVERTGALESLTISNMFQSAAGLHPAGCRCCPNIRDMSDFFQTGILQILRQNTATLRTLKIEGNGFQESLINMLNDSETFPPGLRIRNLYLLTNPHESLPVYTGLLRNVGPTLEKFKLGIRGGFNNEGLANFLIPGMFPVVEKFELYFRGTDNHYKQVSLRGIHTTMPRLRSLTVKDTKFVQQSDLRIARGIRHRNRRPVPEQEPRNENSAEKRNHLNSSIVMDFFPDLPITTTQVKLSGLMIPQGNMDISQLERFQQIQSFNNMTKLVIRGPLMQKVFQGFRLVTTELLRLQELTLSDVGLTDAEMAGMSTIRTKTLRRVLNRSQDTVLRFIHMYQQIRDNYWRIEPGQLNELANLTELRSLDLSNNYGITAVGFVAGVEDFLPLRHLNISNCKIFDDNSLKVIQHRCPRLETLGLLQNYKVSYRRLDMMIRHNPNLKRIDTSVSPRMANTPPEQLSNDFHNIVKVKLCDAKEINAELAELEAREANAARRAQPAANAADNEDEDELGDPDDGGGDAQANPQPVAE